MFDKYIDKRDAPDSSLRRALSRQNHPLVCVGPMSKNCVDAVVRLARKLSAPLPLIASRRQVECKEFGGGYVNRWDTSAFAHYVKQHAGSSVPLCRDHGGPWQGETEGKLPQYEAMERAKRALLQDLEAGFDLVHLDPSPCGETLMEPVALQRLFELYGFVCETAYSKDLQIEIEVGTEARTGAIARAEEYEFLVRSVLKFCRYEGYQPPLFCIAQTGTLVRELENAGELAACDEAGGDKLTNSIARVNSLAKVAAQYGVFLKEHNADYLSPELLSMHSSMGIAAVNLAPQLGVFESRCLVGLCLEFGLHTKLDRLLEVFFECGQWHKWLKEGSGASDVEKALMGGHYTFSSERFLEIKYEVSLSLARRIADLDAYLSRRIETLLHRICMDLGYETGRPYAETVSRESL